MRLKKLALVCGLSLAVVLGGCGKADEEAAIKDPQAIIKVENEADKSTQTETNNDTQTEANNDTQTETNNDTQTEVNNDTQTEVNNDTQNETNNEIQSEIIEDNQPEKNEADEKSNAIKAYQDILNAAPALEGEHDELYAASFSYKDNVETFGEHIDSYALVDLDNDEIPELITSSIINFRWNMVNVYTYADGKAILLANVANDDYSVTFDQYSGANGAYLTFVCGENHIHNYWHGTDPMGEAIEENHAYSLEGTSMVEAECSLGTTDEVVFFNDIAKVNSPQ